MMKKFCLIVAESFGTVYAIAKGPVMDAFPPMFRRRASPSSDPFRQQSRDTVSRFSRLYSV